MAERVRKPYQYRKKHRRSRKFMEARGVLESIDREFNITPKTTNEEVYDQLERRGFKWVQKIQQWVKPTGAQPAPTYGNWNSNGPELEYRLSGEDFLEDSNQLVDLVQTLVNGGYDLLICVKGHPAKDKQRSGQKHNSAKLSEM